MIMVEGIIGKKVGMTQAIDENGNMVPVTVIVAGPCTIVQKKTVSADGYSAVQLGFVEDKEFRGANRPSLGHFKRAEIPPTRILREFRFDESDDVKPGDQFSVEIFQVGDVVDITGTSKGKGFAGVVKRWGFHGGRKTHGSMFHRAPGSIGASATPSRVAKGKKMPGQMGDERKTVKNLAVVETDAEKNLLVVKGAVPGAKGGYLLIKKAGFVPQSAPTGEAKSAGKKEPEKAEEKTVEKKQESPSEVKPDLKSEAAKEPTAEAKTEPEKTAEPAPDSGQKPVENAKKEQDNE
jgi:large subunit ribosomal protein L3